MRLKEFLTEQQLSDVHDALDIATLSLPYTYRLTQLKNNDFYDIYRFGVALAAVRGEDGDNVNPYKPKFYPESDWGENQVVSGFDPKLGNVVDKALAKVNKKGKTVVSTPGSDEMLDTYKDSLLKPFKGYAK
jgi:hypothetical protein